MCVYIFFLLKRWMTWKWLECSTRAQFARFSICDGRFALQSRNYSTRDSTVDKLKALHVHLLRVCHIFVLCEMCFCIFALITSSMCLCYAHWRCEKNCARDVRSVPRGRWSDTKPRRIHSYCRCTPAGQQRRNDLLLRHRASQVWLEVHSRLIFSICVTCDLFFMYLQNLTYSLLGGAITLKLPLLLFSENIVLL